MAKILGIDPSLTGTGMVYLENGRMVKKELIKTKPTGDNKVAELNRLMFIARSFDPVGVDIAVMEGVAYMARNTTALVQLSALNYLIREGLYICHIPFVIVAPTTLKKFITGKGNAAKDEIMMDVYKKYHVTLTNDNEADAYCLARIGEALLNKKIKLSKPQKEVIKLLREQLKIYEKYNDEK